ncbi:MAG: autophagy-related protein 18a-like [Edafosvirus sp.]|uniref:Autophagy-related protein 18a-like n=1 Tax=Edafosvirus sp. TaxID=2487765 RepID=A0A3G4ZSS8_9VIRU|nr:MAG: autophagy-related protein 18a-like [Edafosvirus sp.]
MIDSIDNGHDGGESKEENVIKQNIIKREEKEISLPTEIKKELDKREEPILHVSFNQDSKRFICITDSNFIIYQTNPFEKIYTTSFKNKGLGFGEMLFSTNVLSLVGSKISGADTFQLNKVCIWDESVKSIVAELQYRSQVVAVKMKRDKIIIILKHKIYIYNFLDLSLYDHTETHDNIKGLCAINQNNDNFIVACPGLQKGHIRIESYYPIKKTIAIDAHKSNISCITLNYDGSLLATTSEIGTLIRIFSTIDGSILFELRRGSTTANISNMCFSRHSHWLAVLSDRGTLHIFSLSKKIDVNTKSIANTDVPLPIVGYSINPTAYLPKYVSSYISSEWSYTQLKIPDENSFVTFGQDEKTIYVISKNGSFYNISFDPDNTDKKLTILSIEKF